MRSRILSSSSSVALSLKPQAKAQMKQVIHLLSGSHKISFHALLLSF